MQSDIVASCVTVAARLSASVTHCDASLLQESSEQYWRAVSPAFQTSGINLRCFQGLVTLLAIPPHSSSWVSFFLRSLRPAYFTYFLLSSLVHDQGRKERQGWAVDQQSAYCPVVDSGFCMPVSAFSMIEYQLHVSTATTHQYNAWGQLSQRRAADAVEIKSCCYCLRWQ